MTNTEISVEEKSTNLTTLSIIVEDRTISLQIKEIDGQFENLTLIDKCTAEASVFPSASLMNAIFLDSAEQIDAALQLLNVARERIKPDA